MAQRRWAGLIVGIAVAVLASQLAKHAFRGPDPVPTRAEIEEKLLESDPNMMGILKTEFPEEFERLVALTEQLARDGVEGREAGLAVARLMADLRNRLAPTMRHAPATMLREMLQINADASRLVREVYGAPACDRFARTGAGALMHLEYSAELRVLLRRSGAVTFEAFVAARDRPETRDAASDKDWESVIDALIAGGMTEKEFAAAAAAEDPQAPDICPGIVRFLEALLEVKGEAADRAIADIVMEIAAAPLQ